MKKNTEYKENIHYYIEGGRVVFTALFHLQRGKCCGCGCRFCPYVPKHQKNSNEVAEEFVTLKKEP